MDEELRAICLRHGVFLRREAEALGYHDVAMARQVKDRVWHRVRRGAYTFGEIWASLDESDRYALLTRSALRQAKTSVILSHLSALPEYDAPLWGFDLGVVHLTRRDGRTGRKERGVHQHQGRILDGDVQIHDGVPTMSPTRAALEVTTLGNLEASLCVIDNLLHRGLTSPEELRARYVSMERWPNTLTTDLVLRLADGRSESVGETRMGHLCWRQGLPAPMRQYEVVDEHSILLGRVDFAWPEHGVFLEFDGRNKYERFRREGESVADAVLREKHREELICEATGWRCIRIVWADLGRPEFTAMRIRAQLFPGSSVA